MESYSVIATLISQTSNVCQAIFESVTQQQGPFHPEESGHGDASAAPPRMYADLTDFMKVHNLPRYVLGAKTESEEDELLQQEAHELEEAAEEEDVLIQQELHDLEEEEDEKLLQQDSAPEEDT